MRLTPVAILLGGLLTSTGHAQQSVGFVGQKDANSPDSGESLSKADEIIVTAQKREERLKDVPISISVLGGKALDQSTYHSMEEVLQTVPGVAYVPANSNSMNLSIRGVGAQSTALSGSSTVGYYIDTIPFGLIRSGTVPDLNPYDLQRIEVLRGPQGTLYGASSAAGLVRVLTNNAELDRFEMKGRFIGSSTRGGGGNYSGDAAVNIPLVEGKLALRMVAGYQNLSGWIDGPVGKNINDSEVQNYRVKLNAKPTESLSIGLSLWLNRGQYGQANLSADDGTYDSPTAEPGYNDFDAYGLNVSYDFSNFSVSSASSYLRYAGGFTRDQAVFGYPNTSISVNDFSHIFTEELTFSSKPGATWNWTAGLFYRDADQHRYDTWPGVYVVNGIETPTDFTDKSKSIAAFGQIGRRLFNDKLEFTLGVRHFRDYTNLTQAPGSFPNPAVSGVLSKNKYRATTPKAVLTWYPSRSVTVYASYAQGFRSGLPQNAVLKVFIPDVPDAKPDKLTSYEAGLKMETLGGRLSFDSSIYYLKWDDVQQTLNILLDTPGYKGPAGGITNGPGASGMGADVAITARPLRGLEFSLTGSWNDLTFDTGYLDPIANDFVFRKGDRLLGSPKYTFGGSMQYVFPIGASGWNGRVNASGSYISRQQGRGANIITQSDPFFISRAQLSIESRNGLSFTLFADNINNERGKISPPFVNNDFKSSRVRPRTVGLQVNYRFD